MLEGQRLIHLATFTEARIIFRYFINYGCSTAPKIFKDYSGIAFGLTLHLKVSLVILAKASDHLQARKELSRDGCLSYISQVL